MRINKKEYAIGIDFGTLSGRAVIVDVSNGVERATAVHEYLNGVIDEYLPRTRIDLEPDWALQDPHDYIDVLKQTVPAVLKETGIDPRDVIGVGIDFTACAMKVISQILRIKPSTTCCLQSMVPYMTTSVEERMTL